MIKPKKKILPASLIVTQSNELVSARYTLPLGEQRLILTMIARIQPEDEDFKPYKISIGEFADFLGVNKDSAYRECKKLTKSLLSRVIEIRDTDKLVQIGWVSSAVYVDGAGMVILSFDPLLKPYLLQLKGNFTSCKLEMILSFKSQYTMRMYTFLKQYERIKVREIELDLLRETLGLRPDQNKDYKHFKSGVLLPVQKELVEKADLTFGFEEIKHGRRVGAIRFHISTKKLVESNSEKSIVNIYSPSSLLDEEPLALSSSEENAFTSIDQLRLFVLEQHRTKETIKVILEEAEKKHGFHYVKRNILYSNVKAKKSYIGFLKNALTEDWAYDWDVDQQIKPIKKKATEVWEQQGFSSLKKYEDFMYRKQMKEYGISV